MTSLVAEHQLWSTGSELWRPGLFAPRHVGSSWTGIKPVSLALQGAFLTTGPRVMYLCSVMSDSFVTSWRVTHQASLSIGFSRQDYWSGLPFPSSGDLPHPGMEPCISWVSCIGRGILYHCAWEALNVRFLK